MFKSNKKLDIFKGINNHKIIVSHPYHDNADQNILRHYDYLGSVIKKYRHILGKWHVYRLRPQVLNYTPTICDIYLPKEVPN